MFTETISKRLGSDFAIEINKVRSISGDIVDISSYVFDWVFFDSFGDEFSVSRKYVGGSWIYENCKYDSSNDRLYIVFDSAKYPFRNQSELKVKIYVRINDSRFEKGYKISQTIISTRIMLVDNGAIQETSCNLSITINHPCIGYIKLVPDLDFIDLFGVADIVQNTGTSTSSVMSQNATTNAVVESKNEAVIEAIDKIKEYRQFNELNTSDRESQEEQWVSYFLWRNEFNNQKDILFRWYDGQDTEAIAQCYYQRLGSMGDLARYYYRGNIKHTEKDGQIYSFHNDFFNSYYEGYIYIALKVSKGDYMTEEVSNDDELTIRHLNNKHIEDMADIDNLITKITDRTIEQDSLLEKIVVKISTPPTLTQPTVSISGLTTSFHDLMTGPKQISVTLNSGQGQAGSIHTKNILVDNVSQGANITSYTGTFNGAPGLQTRIKGRIGYNAGNYVVDDLGVKYRIEAGEKFSSDITISLTLPFFATTSNITTLTKQALQSISTVITITFAAESGGNKQTIQLGDEWGTLTKIEQEDPLVANSWLNVPLSTFTKVNDVTSVAGTGSYQLRHNGATVGKRKMKFTF